MGDLGPYVVEGELGRGGMGAVYRARGPDGRVVAIKTLLRADAKDVERFERERRLLAALGDADGFVPLIDSGTTPRGPFLVMPLVPGGTLRDRLESTVPIDEAIRIGRALASAMGRAHAKGIVHRDLKPENVLFTEDGRPLITDLGLAKHFDKDASGASQSVALTKTGEMRGTAAYMAPEQLNDAKSVGPASDVFALGAILYELLAGEPAFKADSIHATFAAIAQCRPRPIRKLRSDCPRWLARVVGRALSARIADRPPDGAALDALLALGPANEPRRWPLALVAVALAAAGAFAFTRGSSEEAIAPVASATTTPPVATTPATPPLPPVLRTIPVTRHARLALAMGKQRAPGGDPFGDGKGEFVYAVAVSPDGTKILSGNHGDSEMLWRDAATGRELARLRGHTGCVRALAISPDGKQAISGGQDKTVRIWDLETATLARTFPAHDPNAGTLGHDAPVRGVAFIPGQPLAVSGAEDSAIRLWNLGPGEQRDSLVLEGNWIQGLAMSADGTRLLAPSLGRVVSVVDPPRRRFSLDILADGARIEDVIRYFRGHEDGVNAAVFVRGTDRVVSAGGDKVLRLWDANTLKELRVLGRHDDGVRALAIFPSGRVIASASSDRTIRLWDFRNGDELDRIDLSSIADVANALAVSPDGTALFAGTDRGLVLRFEASGLPK